MEWLVATFTNVEDTNRNTASSKSVSSILDDSDCEDNVPGNVDDRMLPELQMLISQAKLNRYRLICWLFWKLRSRHIQILSCSHLNFCLCQWLTTVLSTACRRAGPACHCQCHESAHSVSLEKLSANVDQLCVLLMLKCCYVCGVGCNRPIQCRPNCNN